MRRPEEVLLADDGSGDETRVAFELWARAQSFRSDHVMQENEGFRRSWILNEAIARTRRDYRVFLDGRSRAMGYHPWHLPKRRGDLDLNDELLAQAHCEGATRGELGLDQHLLIKTS